MPLVVVGLSHRSAPVELRERFAFAEKELEAALNKLKQDGLVNEAVILSTCNRVEIYAQGMGGDIDVAGRLRRFLCESRGCQEPPGEEVYAMAEPHSVEHLFKVASGLDSMVLGETEILGQLKKAYDLALQSGHTGPRLNKAFQKAFNVAKQIRTETNIQRGSVSVGSVAVELAEKIFNSLNDRRVLVLGAGDTSERTARALLSRGAHSIFVSNRSHERAQALAAELGGRAIRYDEWAKEFSMIDIIISSTSATHYILDRVKLAPLLKGRRGRSLLLIDIAVPRDIEPEVNFLEGVYLYNIDDLQEIANDYLRQRHAEIGKCQALIQERAAALVETMRPRHEDATEDARSGEEQGAI